MIISVIVSSAALTVRWHLVGSSSVLIRYWHIRRYLYCTYKMGGSARVSSCCREPAASPNTASRRTRSVWWDPSSMNPELTNIALNDTGHRYSPDDCAAVSHNLITGTKERNNNVLLLLLFLSRFALSAQAGRSHRNTISGLKKDSQHHGRRMGGA